MRDQHQAVLGSESLHHAVSLLLLQFPACSLPGAEASTRDGVAECWEEEQIASEQEGLVVFDGGSYSLGPAAIGEALRRR